MTTQAEARNRAVAAGAVEPLNFIGQGAEGVVFCDAKGLAFKVGRYRTLLDEAEWLETAQHVPWVKNHVAKFYRFDRENNVIVRECVETRSTPLGGGRRSPDEARIWSFMRDIERRMKPYGWNAPEGKADAAIATRDRGLVIVDAGFAMRFGTRLARHTAQLLREPSPDVDWGTVAWAIRAEMDAGRISRTSGEKLLQRIEEATGVRDNPRTMAKAKKSAKKGSKKGSKKTPGKFTGASRKNMTLAQLRAAHPQYKFGKGTGQFKHLVYVQFSSSADDREWARTPGDLQKSLAGGKWGPGAQALAKKPAKLKKGSMWGFDAQTGVELSKKDRRPSHQAVIEDWLRSKKLPVPRDKRSKNWRAAVKAYESQGAAFARTQIRPNPMNPQSALVKRAILGMRASHYKRFMTLKHMFESGDLNGAAHRLHTRAVGEAFDGGGGYDLEISNIVAFLRRNKANVARWLNEAKANEHEARRAVAKVRNNPITTKTSKRRLNASDSCTPRQASKLMRDRKKAKRQHKKMPYRQGRCATPSAEYVLHYHGKGKKSRSKPRRPKNTHPRTHSKPRTAPARARRSTGSMVDWFI